MWTSRVDRGGRTESRADSRRLEVPFLRHARAQKLLCCDDGRHQRRRGRKSVVFQSKVQTLTRAARERDPPVARSGQNRSTIPHASGVACSARQLRRFRVVRSTSRQCRAAASADVRVLRFRTVRGRTKVDPAARREGVLVRFPLVRSHRGMRPLQVRSCQPRCEPECRVEKLTVWR
jgi:hypothetical protein